MSNDVQQIDVTEAMVGVRVDRWLMKEFDVMNFAMVNKLIRTGQLRLNGKRLKNNSRFEEVGQVLRVPPVRNEAPKPVAEKPCTKLNKADFDEVDKMIIFQDDEMVVLNKPAGLAVQGGSKQERHVDGLMRGYFGDDADPKLVHRLDRATSGILLVAKNVIAASRLTAAFRDDQVDKTYWAIVCGEPPVRFDIEEPLIKAGSAGNERMYVDPEGKYSRTLGRRLYQSGDFALVELKPITGRTHQLRVHLSHIGTPIYGDGKYGAPRAPFMALHAKKIRVPDPATGHVVSFAAPLPTEFERQLKVIGYEDE